MYKSQLYLHNRPVDSIFDLLGTDENAVTYCVGWALHSSPTFLSRFLRETAQFEGALEGVEVHLQEYGRSKGFTDIEIRKHGELHIVIEAKKGSAVPGVKQLEKYAARLSNNGCSTRRILVLSDADASHVDSQLHFRAIKGIAVEAATWKTVANIARHAITHARHTEKRLLAEMLSYVGRLVAMQDRDIESNMVYVVSLDGKGIVNWEKRKVYFHRVRGGPKKIPNYIAARYKGRLRSIRHVRSYEQVDGSELLRRSLIEKLTRNERGPQRLYKFERRDIVPPREIKSGKIRNRRVSCMLDTLLTCDTVQEAEILTQKRRKLAGRIGG